MVEKKDSRLAFRVTNSMLEAYDGLLKAYKVKTRQELFERLVEHAKNGALEPKVVVDSQVFERAGATAALAGDSEWRPSPYLKSVVERMGARLGCEPMLALDTIAGWFEDTFEGREVVGMAEVLAGASLADALAGEAEMSPAGLQTPTPDPSTLKVANTCAHCGCAFMSDRVVVMCPGCFTEGHRGDVRACAACNEGSAL